MPRPKLLDDLETELLRVGGAILDTPEPEAGRRPRFETLRRRGLRVLPAVFSLLVVVGVGGVALFATTHRAQLPRHVKPLSAGHASVISQTAGYSPNGNPILAVAANHPRAVTWEICPPVGRCRRQRSSTLSSGGSLLRLGATPSGTLIRASVGGATRQTQSKRFRWLGTVRATTPPMLKGRPRIHGTVRVLPAAWIGGWAFSKDPHQLSIEACVGAALNRGCVTVASSGPFFRGSTVVGLTPRLLGRYLIAVDERFPAHTVVPTIKYSSVEHVPMPLPGGVVASSDAFGPVTR